MKWLYAALSLILIWTQVIPNSPSWGSGLTMGLILLIPFIWKNLQGSSNSSPPPSTSPPSPSPAVPLPFVELSPFGSEVDKANGKIGTIEILQLYKDKKNLKGIDASGGNLSKINLSGADLSGANLENTNLRGAIFRGANLKQANLKGADLSGASLDKANLYEADLSKARLRGASLIETYLVRTNLKGAILTLTDLNTAVLCKTTDPSGIQLNKNCDELGIPCE